MSKKLIECFFIANNNIGDSGLSGGCRIFIELARYWKESINLKMIATEEAITVCKNYGLGDLVFYKSSNKLGFKNVFSLYAVFINLFKKLTNGIIFVLKNRVLFKNNPWVYSVSDFYPDLIPAFLIKLINPKIRWIAGYYLFAPAPWDKESPYKGKDAIRGFLYWISQRPTYWIVKNFADIVFVTSEPDRNKFVTKRRKENDIFVIRGGVNIEASTEYLNGKSIISIADRKYDCCFIGRFHQQKGVLVLMEIWKKVIAKLPKAKLAMIGNGPLEVDVQNKIDEYGLNQSVALFGFLDGDKKNDIFKQSKIVLHPATYDSGGMAAAEAMAWALPGISFDLEALKTYYPQGMIKVPKDDYNYFAEQIIKVLADPAYYRTISQEARDLIVNQWSWEKRAQLILEGLLNNNG
ncbi:MAG: glycosyltransferase [Candidatus Omnitrophica bacterium]|nr:glycosyltransferase [Candidatus Omnitrophota bacterium]